MFPAISAVHHPLLEGKSVFLPLVLSPNVLYLEKKEQTLTNAYCFPTKNATSASAPTQMSAPLPGCPGVGVAGPGTPPPPLASPAVSTDGAHELDGWPPLEVAWFPEKQILCSFLQEGLQSQFFYTLFSFVTSAGLHFQAFHLQAFHLQAFHLQALYFQAFHFRFFLRAFRTSPPS